MKQLLTTMALFEAATGLALLLSPALPVSFLLGAVLETPGGATVARVAGAALLALGVACWQARNERQGEGGRSVVAAMAVYNLAAVTILVHASLALGLSAVGLWPAVVLHFGLAVWCIACLRPAHGSSRKRA